MGIATRVVRRVVSLFALYLLLIAPHVVASPEGGSTLTALKLRDDCRVHLECAARTKGCDEPDEAIRGLECIVYVKGYMDGISSELGIIAKSQGATTVAEFANFRERYSVFCRPDGVVNRQIVEVFLKFADENPNILHKDAGFVLHLASARAWPCASRNR